MAEIVLVRHGQTEWSVAGRHTGSTDIPLTPVGEEQARAIGQRIKGREFAQVLCSPRVRARRTAELAGLRVTEIVEDLAEWDYGDYEGITTKEIHETSPDWYLWTDGVPGGESPERIGARIDRVLAKARAALEHGDVALVAHGHALRVVGARWIEEPVRVGGRLRLDTATLCRLGFEHGRPVILEWNSR
ncbi:histidine phosphatase family protein [Catenuloplanes atrovinosus]|uniref:Phosphoglycerate mutase n=1 Tax=Catenuloplanes atrovinosus TaxID=137266 RepID=A0AAE3YLJ4_9ACTN|nr:histidine phosphatase family protein [Catenuloplanes atrovinosus]MDR7276053.1 putative phosphoglycerate mutase [Catenuloplanes atrovinosus]